MPAELTVISWRDLPAQVNAKAGRTVERVELPPQFQTAIDRAAMNAGLIGSDEYLEQWHRSTRPCGDDLHAEVTAERDRLVSAYSSDRLAGIVDNLGNEQEPAPHD